MYWKDESAVLTSLVSTVQVSWWCNGSETSVADHAHPVMFLVYNLLMAASSSMMLYVIKSKILKLVSWTWQLVQWHSVNSPVTGYESGRATYGMWWNRRWKCSWQIISAGMSTQSYGASTQYYCTLLCCACIRVSSFTFSKVQSRFSRSETIVVALWVNHWGFDS